MKSSKFNLQRAVLGLAVGLAIVVSFQNCGKKESTVDSINNGSNDNTTTTLQPLSSLVVNENFESWFTGGCTDPNQMSSCLSVMGPTSGHSLMIRKFSSICEANQITSWLGGGIPYHGDPRGNPTAANWAPVRFNYGTNVNEPLMTRNKQTKTNGSVSMEFVKENGADDLITLVANANFSEIPGCAVSRGIATYNKNTVTGIYAGYFPNISIGGSPKNGFLVYVVKAGAPGAVEASFIEHNLTNSWYRVEFSRTGDYVFTVSKYSTASGWAVVGSKNVSASLVGSMDLGYIGVNSDVTGNVSFDNININW